MTDNDVLPEYASALVPASEIQKRIENFQQWLALETLDGAFILQNVDLYYFSGTLQRAILFIPREGQPILMVMKSFERARCESSLQDVYPLVTRGEIFSLLRDFGHGPLGRVGLELDVLPAETYLWFQKKIGGARFVDVSREIRKLRMIKSPYEVDQIRRATAVLDIGFREIQGEIREGMTELAVDGILAQIARREGHMGILRMRGWNQEMSYAHVLSGESGAVVSFGDTPAGGSGNTPAVAQGAGFRRIGKNEPICIDYGVGINGYLSDQTRTFVIGKLADNLAKAHACSHAILEKLEAEVRPGIPCADLFDWAERMARDSGFEDNFMGYGEGKVKFLGHGFGLEIDEYPIITPAFSEPIREGMVIALEPKFIFPRQGIVGIEDDYLVTPTGLERLTLTDQTLLRVS